MEHKILNFKYYIEGTHRVGGGGDDSGAYSCGDIDRTATIVMVRQMCVLNCRSTQFTNLRPYAGGGWVATSP